MTARRPAAPSAVRGTSDWPLARLERGAAAVVVHDAFLQWGGGERVAAHLAAALGDTPVLTAAFRPELLPPPLEPSRMRASPVQRLVTRGVPLVATAPVLPALFSRMDVRGARIVVSSSSAFAHHVRASRAAVHLCYCHTPPRFLWDPVEYFRDQPARWLALRPALAALRRADLAASRRVHLYLANSRHVAARIRRVYGRQAAVVYPPVDTRDFEPSTERSGRFLVVSRLRNHKRVDLAVAAANLIGAPLDVVGEGPELDTLRWAAGPTIRFLGPLPDAEVRHAMARCAGLLVPAAQDFGLTLVEVQASGRPPIALAEGGAAEIVQDGVSGFLFREQAPGALAAAMRQALTTPLDTSVLVRSAGRFDVTAFRAGLDHAIGTAIERRAADLAAARATAGRPARSRPAPGLPSEEPAGAD